MLISTCASWLKTSFAEVSVRCLSKYINNTGQQKFLRKCVYHKTIMCLYLFWGADFENDIENFVVSMVLPLFEVI